MRPAQRAVAGVDPPIVDRHFPDARNVGRRGRAQASPKIGPAAIYFQHGVGHAGQRCFNPPRQQCAAGARKGRGQAQVITAHFDGAGHTQLVAQAADGALDLVINQTNRRRRLGFQAA